MGNNYANDKIVIKSKPKVIVNKKYLFTRGKVELGWIDAEFDFTHLPENLHYIGIQMVAGTTQVYVTLDQVKPIEEKSEAKRKRVPLLGRKAVKR